MSEVNPIIRLRAKPSRTNAIKAKCAECMGCTAVTERGFRIKLGPVPPKPALCTPIARIKLI